MAARTNSEKISELEKIAATLTERIDTVRDEMVDRERFAVVEERINEIKKTIENSANRLWWMWASVIGAVVGSVITGFFAILGKALTQ